jgi:hypothetical protein
VLGHCRSASAMHGQMTSAVAYPRPAEKGAHFPKEIMLTDVRWYVAYPLCSTTRFLARMLLTHAPHDFLFSHITSRG